MKAASATRVQNESWLIIRQRASVQPNQIPSCKQINNKNRMKTSPPAVPHIAAISLYPVRMMKHTYLCCKITAQLMYFSTVRLDLSSFFFFFASLQISISSSRSWLFKLYCCGPRVQQKPWPIGSLLFMHIQWIRFCFYPELYFTWVSSVYVTGGARIQSQREMLRGQSI